MLRPASMSFLTGIRPSGRVAAAEPTEPIHVRRRLHVAGEWCREGGKGADDDQPHRVAPHDGFLRSRRYGGHSTRHGPGRDINVCNSTRPHPWSQFADTPQAFCLEKTHPRDHAHPSRLSLERGKPRPLLRRTVASVLPRPRPSRSPDVRPSAAASAARQEADRCFAPVSLPLEEACSISALISPPIKTKRPVTYIQVSSTMTAPMLP
jgi:hypothetical protein